MTTFSNTILAELNEAQTVLNNFISNPEIIARLEAAARLMSGSILNCGKILSCGNGGSMCDAMNFA